MANVDSPLGLRPIGNGVAGTAPRITEYIRSGTAVIYEGALLVKNADGVDVYNGTTAAQAYNVIGVAAHYAAASETHVLVYDDPAQEFLIQGDSAVATPLMVIGWYGNLTAVTGNGTTLQSKSELDTSELTSTYAAFDVCQVRRRWDAQDNDQDAANAKWVVKITDKAHALANTSTRVT
jgi:hypothetical protein